MIAKRPSHHLEPSWRRRQQVVLAVRMFVVLTLVVSPTVSSLPLRTARANNSNLTSSSSSLLSFRKLWASGSRKGWDIVESLSRRLLSQESAAAVKTVRQILTSVDEHGVVDVFGKYRQHEVFMSVIALSRLQQAAHWYDTTTASSTVGSIGGSAGVASGSNAGDVVDKRLVRDLARYATYANAAYGWTMDLAFSGRLHWGDLRMLLRRTGLSREDVVVAKWEAKTHRPAYFIVRDRREQNLVLCVRGTWSPHDVLTDLCCTAQDFQTSITSSKTTTTTSPKRRGRRSRAFTERGCAHHGMLRAAQALKSDAEALLRDELKANPNFSLVLVGHSMGGGVAALLGTLLEDTFSDLRVYVYGAPCVAPIDARPTGHSKIVSVVGEGDPFSCLSLGHVADVSVALDVLCEDGMLRNEILLRTDERIEDMDERDLEWCSRVMGSLRGRIRERGTTEEKLFPPGRILFLSPRSNNGRAKNPGNDGIELRQVNADRFQDLAIRPRMFDLTRHFSSHYESRLRVIADQ